MGLFDKLFGGGKKKVSRETAETRGLHMPDLNIPVDEKFTIHFKKNGGKFLYCDSFSEIAETLDNIIIENKWQDQAFFSMDDRLEAKFSKQGLIFTQSPKKEHGVFHHLRTANSPERFYLGMFQPTKRIQTTRFTRKSYCFCHYQSISGFYWRRPKKHQEKI